ncbi:hypothetical protein [Streptomyces bottropensis]|uniref:hypothetical protein n=1 Tax=Streptomyces bottropensis TaxID=42235 RepID=UPI0036D0D134
MAPGPGRSAWRRTAGKHGVAVAEPDWPRASVAAAVADGAHAPSPFAPPTLVSPLSRQGRPAFDPQA